MHPGGDTLPSPAEGLKVLEAGLSEDPAGTLRKKFKTFLHDIINPSKEDLKAACTLWL